MANRSEITRSLSPEQLALLQRRLQKKQQEKRAQTAVPEQIGRRSADGPVPLSFGQERMWFLSQLQPDNTAYNIPVLVPLSGAVSVAALEWSLNGIVRRHEALRTTFVLDSGRPVQIIAPSLEIPLSVIDLPTAGGTEGRREVHEWIASELSHAFDLSRGPLLRASLLRIGAPGAASDHLLVLAVHHIVFDAWSTRVLVGELQAHYQAYSQGLRDVALPPLPIQYADFAVWQRRWLQGDVLERALAYWLKQLEGAPAVLELPSDRPRPVLRTGQGAVHAFTVPADVYDRFKALSSRTHSTLFMILLAAFAVLLHRYAGEDDVLVGTPVANRGRSEIEGLIGFFLNTLVLRIDVSGDPTFVDLLKRAREVALGAFAHQDLPFEKLVDAIHPERNLSVNPLFQVMLVLQSIDAAAARAHVPSDVTAPPLDVTSGSARFDLTLSFLERPGELSGFIEYNTDLFDASTIERSAGHLGTLLAAVSRDAEQRVSALPLLTAAERQQLADWNRTDSPLPPLTIHGLVERRAAMEPGALALTFEDQQLTYGELNARANQVARHLLAIRVRSQDLVGIFVERSPEMIVGLLGILKAGAVYLPLDPAYPKDSIAFMLADARVETVVTQEHLMPRLAATPARIVRLDADWERIATQRDDDLRRDVHPSDPAYVIYTSGSTGRPKGVVVPHRGAVNCAEVEARTFEIQPSDRVLQFATLNFDASLYDMIMCWWGGAVLSLAQRESVIPGPELIRLLREQTITVLPIPPSALAVLPVEALPALRLITVMGEDCPQELVARWQSVPRFFNAYGPTETTMWSAGGYLDARRKPTIGRPIANSQIHLLDGYLNEVPIGVPGELYIGGIGVTNGYLFRPDLTAERFIPNPFSARRGARLYKTGDIARYLPNGEIDFLGRRDLQVKIRGYRIELGEIESTLHQHPTVKDVLVLVRDDLPTGRGIVAYVVGEAEVAPDPGTLRRFLEEKLPRHMVPSAFVLLDAIPLTSSGKADRQALPLPEAAPISRARTFTAPESAVEATLARIWAEVLGVDRVGVDENFFELGGHSLLATQIVTRVRHELRVELPMRHLFEAPTIASLGAIVQEIRRSGETLDVDGLDGPVVRSSHALLSVADEDVDREIARVIAGLDAGQKKTLLAYLLRETTRRPETCEASYGQERLWFLDRLEPGNAAYNLPMALPLAGELDVDALSRSLNDIVRRHEALRTTFRIEDGRPVQLIAPELRVELNHVVVNAQTTEERVAEYERMAAAEASRSFDLEKGPLLSATLVRNSAYEHVLLLTIHHIVADGWSMGIFCRELATFYEAHVKRQASPLPELTAQYSTFVHWQRDRLRGKFLEESLAFWKGRFEGAPSVLDLPFDRPRPRLQSYTGAVEFFDLTEDLVRRIVALGQREDATLFMTLLAAFDVFLSRHTGTDDILVGTPITNRSRVEFEPIIGFFVNTLVLRARLSPSQTFQQLLRSVRDEMLEAYTYQDLPFEKLVEELQPDRSLSVNPLFQVMFSLHRVATSGGTEAPDAAVPQTAAAMVTAKFDLTLHVVETKQGLMGAFEYKTDLFDATTIRRMAASFQALLEGLVADPHRRLLEISSLTAADLDFLTQSNDTTVGYDLEPTLHGRFERQVESTPHATAVIFEDDAISYAELDAKAAQVAHLLRQHGVGPETRVAICMDRSIEMVVGLLGILKAGGAYVPLDPTYPRERLAFMLKDAAPLVLLTKGRLIDGLPLDGLAVLRLDDDWQAAVPPILSDRPSSVSADNLAYLIYTSGSTGLPKAVMITHRAIGNRLLWMQDAYGLTSDDRVLQKTPLGFDVSVWEVFWPLITGATMVVARPEGHRDSTYLAHLIAARSMTHVHFVPSMLQAFLKDPHVEGLRTLKRVICSGEELPPDLQQHYYERLDAELHNLYGPTEAAVDVTSRACVADEHRSSVPIGRPIANIRLYILDSHLERVPIGVAGELFIAGVGLARGYRNRPGLTAERFIANPFSDRPGERMYKTGDRARYLSNGEIEFLGRLDRQLKIRGFRIELGEIEAALANHPSVDEAVVVGREVRAGGGDELIAYVVARAGASCPSEELRTWLTAKLPQYMVPAHYHFLETMPLTANGKLDMKALPAPDVEAQTGGAGDRPPRNPVEQILASIWAEVLGIASVGVNQNFFQLGGHSLLAHQAISRIREMLGVEWPLTGFFESPSPAALAVDILRDPERRARVETRAQLLMRVSELTDDEVDRMLGTDSARAAAAGMHG